MPWVKLDDHFPSHPKIARAGGDAAWLHVCALCYCGAHLTDGEIPREQLPRLSDRKQPFRLAKRLVECSLWTETATGFLINDFLEFNPSREQVLAERLKARERSAKVRANFGRTSAAPSPSRPEVPTEPIAQRLSTGCGWSLERCSQMVEMLRNEGIGELVLDEAAGKTIEAQPKSPNYFIKVAQNWFQQRTGGAG